MKRNRAQRRADTATPRQIARMVKEKMGEAAMVATQMVLDNNTAVGFAEVVGETDNGTKRIGVTLVAFEEPYMSQLVEFARSLPNYAEVDPNAPEH